MNDNSAGWPETGELPASNKVRNDPALVQKYPALKAFLDELPYAHYETSAPGITNAEATITDAVNAAVTGKSSPKDALDAAAAKADKLLAQNKQTYGD
jgi:multiple sugar transport system substrate-binding protein